jgi:hypothetical protein
MFSVVGPHCRLPEFLRTRASWIPSANNSTIPLGASQMQTLPPQTFLRSQLARIGPTFCALTPCAFRPLARHYYLRPTCSLTTAAATSAFLEIRRNQMRNNPLAVKFTEFRKSQRRKTFRSAQSSARSEPLRIFRDLIIFRENEAQMRNDRHAPRP